MEKINNTIKTYAQVITFLIIWAIVLLVSNVFNTIDIWTALTKIPIAISIYALIVLWFIKAGWRIKILQRWIVKIPDLQGTWKGELKSDWIDPSTGKHIDPIPIVLVIRQTYSQIKCILMTKESSSYSTTADINTINSGEELYLSYNYTNRPKATIRDRSAIHDGATILKIIKVPDLYLEGEYWTSRKTRGEMSLKFFSKSLIERFEP